MNTDSDLGLRSINENFHLQDFWQYILLFTLSIIYPPAPRLGNLASYSPGLAREYPSISFFCRAIKSCRQWCLDPDNLCFLITGDDERKNGEEEGGGVGVIDS